MILLVCNRAGHSLYTIFNKSNESIRMSPNYIPATLLIFLCPPIILSGTQTWRPWVSSDFYLSCSVLTPSIFMFSIHQIPTDYSFDMPLHFFFSSTPNCHHFLTRFSSTLVATPSQELSDWSCATDFSPYKSIRDIRTSHPNGLPGLRGHNSNSACIHGPQQLGTKLLL